VLSWCDNNDESKGEGDDRDSVSMWIDKVVDKVMKEWLSKDRGGIDVRRWLWDNPKRKQQAQTLLKTYQQQAQQKRKGRV